MGGGLNHLESHSLTEKSNQAIIQSIFPDVIDGDLLKLVHLSNGFRMLPGETSLRVGDRCKAEGRIASVMNNDSGKTVKVKGYVMRDGKPVVEVTSAFLYRGRFHDHYNSFEIVDEDDYAVELRTEADLSVLKSKDWLEWVDNAVQITTGDTLIFRLQSEIYYKTQSTIAKVAVSGNIYLRNQLKELIRVASVDFERENVRSNPIKAYLERHGTVVGLLIPLENQGYTIDSSIDEEELIAPLSNVPYADISGDLNPIHVNPYFADYALLPNTITHGMWTSAATRKYVENSVANGDPRRILA
jgi:fatty acid synthase subunit alpha, fungi type